MSSRATVRVDGHEYIVTSDESARDRVKWWLTVQATVWMHCDDGRYVVLSKAHLERAEIIIEEIEEHG